MSDSHTILIEKCRDGYLKNVAKTISKRDKQKYIDRIKYELEVIHQLGFDDYFLIVHDIVNFAESQNIRVGPGRGSAAGSLVSFCLGITKLDPIKYNLYFERFLNKDRISAPDIDIDFESKGRNKVVSYIKKKYGSDRVSQVITYSTMKARGLIRDIAKAMEIDVIDMEKMSKLVDYKSTDIEDALVREPKLQEWIDKYPELFDIAINLKGCIKNASMHAAGVLITKDPLLNSLPVMYGGKKDEVQDVISQWGKETLEDLNFLKIDALGLSTMDIIHETLDMIGKDVLKDMPLDDQYVLKEFSKGNSIGIFQFETPGMRKILQKVHPEKLEDLSAVNALDRPGAKQGLDIYLKGKQSGQIYYFNDERLKPILLETYGTITYQEQAIAICEAVAGFSKSKADLVRRGIAKPKPGQFEKFREEFIEGCKTNGQTQEWAEFLFDIIKQSQNYAFNKSHATAYAYIGYQCMYLKLYYPVEFMTVLLSNWSSDGWEKGGKLDSYEREAQRLGIKIIDWDINESKHKYTCDLENRTITRGLSAIMNVGKAGLHIEKLKPFRSFTDFYTRVNKRDVRSDAIKALVLSGCFDSIEPNREEMSRWLNLSVTKQKPQFEQGLLFE